jgi:TonB family protein
MFELMIVIGFFWWLPGMQQPTEKQTLTIAKKAPVNEQDKGLPGSPSSSWFELVVSQRSGVIWQLGECGQSIIDPTMASTQVSLQDSTQLESRDIPACVEANAVLPDGRKEVVMIRVGSFENGITENPGLASVDLPEVKTTSKLVTDNILRSELPEAMKNGDLLAPSFDAASPPPPPAGPSAQASNGSSKTIGVEEKSLGDVSWGDAITKVQPRYPPAAKRINASGTVEVKITVSEIGRVIEAKAISGHPLLREAAEDAARQWVFRPVTLKGSAMVTQQILTFVFKVPQ